MGVLTFLLQLVGKKKVNRKGTEEKGGRGESLLSTPVGIGLL